MANRFGLPSNWVIYHVPEDVWRSIFGLVVAEGPTIEGMLSVLALTHVCSAWRSIASCAPELWTRIVLLPRTMSKFPNDELFSLIIRNSGDTPLVLECPALTHTNVPDSTTNIQPAIRFFGQMYRAERLKISAATFYAILRLDPPSFCNIAENMGRAHWLQELVLDLEGDIAHFLLFLASMWKTAENFHILRIQGSRIVYTAVQKFEKAMFPFHQLTTLDVQNEIRVDALLSFLRCSAHLVTARFCCVVGSLSSETPLIHLHRLQTLELGGSRGWNSRYGDAHSPPMTKVLAFIKAPVLITLKLVRDRDFDIHAFRLFSENSTSRLRYLSFAVDESMQQDNFECLRLLPSLQKLDIIFSGSIGYRFEQEQTLLDVFTAALQEWDPQSDQFVVCPELCELSIDYDAIVPTSGSKTVFADMVEERWRQQKGSQSFKLTIVMREVVEDEDGLSGMYEVIRLLALKNAGLNVCFTRYHYLEDIICRNISEI